MGSIGGAELHYMPLLEKNHYLIDLNAIPEELADRAKLMIVSYPTIRLVRWHRTASMMT